MAKVEFQLPDIGEGLEEGEIVSWLVAPGDTVRRDQPLVEVQTDKALVELPSPVAGHVVSLAFSAGDIVKVGQVLVVLEDGHGGDTGSSPSTSPAARRVSTPGVPAPAGPDVDFPDVAELSAPAPAPASAPATGATAARAPSTADPTSAPAPAPASAPATAPATAATPASAATPAPATPASAATPAPATCASANAPAAAPIPAGTGPATSRGPAGRPKAAPAVRKLAIERGVDLTTVTGTGPGGRILASDVESAATAPPTGVHQSDSAALRNAGTAPAPTPTPTGVPDRGHSAVRNAGSAGGIGWMEVGRHPLRGIRRVTAEAMFRSWSEIPHLTTMDEVDATGLLAARRRLAEAGIDTTIGALLVAAVARGLRRYPVLNASLELAPSGADAAPSSGAAVGVASAATTGASLGAGVETGERDSGRTAGGTIVIHPECNIGLAVATAEGLVVPVIRQADRRSLSELAAEVRRLTEAARQRRVEVGDLRGGTFTISNYGSLGGRFATPLIRPPEVGIMGFGAIRPRPFVVDGEVKARPTLPWSLSADHRLIDGDVATAFAEYVTGLLADPIALLAELLGSAG